MCFSPCQSKCLTPDVALSVLDDGGGEERLTDDDYQRISAVLLYYAINLRDLCSASPASPSTSPGNHQFYLLALASLHPDEDGLFLSAGETESILQRINQHYHPTNGNASPEQQVGGFISPFLMRSLPYLQLQSQREHFTIDPQQCADASDLFEHLGLQENPGAAVSAVPRVASAIISHILQGGCFRRKNLPSPAFFTDYIFQSLNRTSNLQIIGESAGRVSLLLLF